MTLRMLSTRSRVLKFVIDSSMFAQTDARSLVVLTNRAEHPPSAHKKEFPMRAKYLALASATGLDLLALTGVQSAAQAEEGYRHGYYRVEHSDRGHDRGRFWFHFRHDRYRDHDRR